MNENLQIAVRRAPGRTTVSLGGELDLATVWQLRVVLDAVVAERPRRLLLELAAVSFIDVTGLAVLVRTQQELASAGGTLTLRQPSRMLRRLLTVLDLTDTLPTEREEPAGAEEPAAAEEPNGPAAQNSVGVLLSIPRSSS